jgi:hypothetical protein
VVFYFLNKDFKVQSLLVKMKHIREAYTRENIIKAVIFIIKEIVSSNRLRFFKEDNASKNGIIIRTIITHLCLNEKDLNFRRIRYIGHIINLAVKRFLFK